MSMTSADSSVIPLRHSSFPGIVRLPKRYKEGESRSLDNRKCSIGHLGSADKITERLTDLSQALLWVKQELVRPISVILSYVTLELINEIITVSIICLFGEQ